MQPPIVFMLVTEDPQSTRPHGEPLFWVLGKPRPFSDVDGTVIVRMFKTENGVEVYWKGPKGADGEPITYSRCEIPWRRIFTCDEVMTAEVFEDEILRAEEEQDDESDEPAAAAHGDPASSRTAAQVSPAGAAAAAAAANGA